MRAQSLNLREAVLVVTAVAWIAGCSVANPASFVLSSTVLSPEQGEIVLRQCSRWAPTEVTEFWKPGPDMIKALEVDLPKLERMKARRCCLVKASVRNPGTYYRQYVGVVWEGRELIYVNALSAPEPGWEDEGVVLCDGGTASWGVLYDPAKREFTDLAVNGIS